MRRSRRRSRPRRTHDRIHDRIDDRAVDDQGDRSGHAGRRLRARCRRRSPASPSTAAPSLRAKPISPSRATSMTAMISSPPRSRPAPASRWSPRNVMRNVMRIRLQVAMPSATTRRSLSSTTCSRRCAISPPRRGRARPRGSWRSPDRSARPPLRRRWRWRSAPMARPTLPPPRSTIIGACRCRSRGWRRRRASGCSRSA